MKKVLKIVLAALMVFALVGCNSEKPEPTTDEKDGVKIAVLLPFTGDQSYFDTLAKGVKEANAIDGITVDLFECDPAGAAEEANWMGWFDNVCEDGEYDLVVSGNNSYEAFLYQACEKYPDQKFMNFDYDNVPETGVPANCYVVSYALDDLGYVVGSLSAALTKTGTVGVVVGMDFQGMNRFIGGYIQVLQANDVKYVISYPGSFTDTALGKETAEAMIKKGADVIWQVAGGLGNGVIEACSTDENVWCIGVDDDQYAKLIDSNPTWANTVITSGLKNTDVALVSVCKMVKDGTFDSKLGTAEDWGIALNGVGIAENEFYQANTPEDVKAFVAESLAAVVNGDVEVVDVRDMTAEQYAAEWPTFRDAGRVQ